MTQEELVQIVVPKSLADKIGRFLGQSGLGLYQMPVGDDLTTYGVQETEPAEPAAADGASLTLEYLDHGTLHSAEAGTTVGEALAYAEHLIYAGGVRPVRLLRGGAVVAQGEELENLALKMGE